MVIDGQGAVTTAIRMNAFGETRHQGEAIANRFPGQVYDAETGLHYNWFRSYRAQAGRYTQADPIGVGDGPNVYLYVHSSPVDRIDPWGLFSCCDVDRRTCCDQYERENPDSVAGSYGGVVCCCGEKFACSWTRERHPDIRGNARESWRRCMQEHEEDHFDEVTCPAGKGPSRPNRNNNNRDFVNTQECEAYDRQVRCMELERPECHGKRDCLEQLDRIMNYHLRDANREYGCAIPLIGRNSR